VRPVNEVLLGIAADAFEPRCGFRKQECIEAVPALRNAGARNSARCKLV
jgi:hypothetical protein